MIVSDYAEERKRTIKAINAQNKQRGRQMEQRVMKFLKGNRVPMSGSGSIKGDGQIFSRFGYILVECKCSAGTNSAGEQKLRVLFKWLEKMQLEAKIMGAKFSVLIIHHHDAKQDYVIIPVDAFFTHFGEQLEGAAPFKVIDSRGAYGWTTFRHILELDFADQMRYTVLETTQGSYAMVTLKRFRDLLHQED